MGMDVIGANGNYFRANIWQWRAICNMIHHSGYEVPERWHVNNGEGLRTQEACDIMVEQLRQFLMKLDNEGWFDDQGNQNSHSRYWVSREHLEEFIDFLKSCGGFVIY